MDLLSEALDHLTLARVGLIRAILEAGPKSGPGILPVSTSQRGIGILPVDSDQSGPEILPAGSSRRDGKSSDRLEAYPTNPTLDLPHVAEAVNGLRASGDMMYLPRGLLTAALYHFVRGEPALAEQHLAEAQQIAERGPMPLFLADIHLHRARLAGRMKGEGGMMTVDAKAELAKAAYLIRSLGYGRRYDELADAEAALGKE